MYEVYEDSDSILPVLQLPDPCGVRIEITDELIRLFVGPRDWSWNRKTGVLSGCGTQITPQADEDSNTGSL